MLREGIVNEWATSSEVTFSTISAFCGTVRLPNHAIAVRVYEDPVPLLADYLDVDGVGLR